MRYLIIVALAMALTACPKSAGTDSVPSQDSISVDSIIVDTTLVDTIKTND